MTEPERVGSITEEALKLFQAMNTAGRPGNDESAEHVCTTTWCPVCQVVGFVRANPDAVAQVSHSAATLARSIRDLLNAALTPEEKL